MCCTIVQLYNVSHYMQYMFVSRVVANTVFRQVHVLAMSRIGCNYLLMCTPMLQML